MLDVQNIYLLFLFRTHKILSWQRTKPKADKLKFITAAAMPRSVLTSNGDTASVVVMEPGAVTVGDSTPDSFERQ
jgi:hypothetical protein